MKRTTHTPPSPPRISARRDSVVLVAITLVVLVVAWYVDAFELIARWSSSHREWMLNEVLTLMMVMSLCLTVFALRRWMEARREVDKRHRVERELREGEERLKDLFDNAPVGYHEIDETGRIVRVNRTEASMLGYQPEELVGRGAWEFVVEPVSREAVRKKLTGELPLQSFERTFIRKDGSKVPMQIEDRLVHDHSGTIVGIRSTVLDISARKRAEAELEKTYKELMHVSRQAGMTEVATSVLHNVGNVLNSINVSVTMIEEKLTDARIRSLGKAVEMLQEHAGALGDFLQNDPRGQQLPSYLARLAEYLEKEYGELRRETGELRRNIEHVNEIIVMQQTYAKVFGVVEQVAVADLVDDALRLNAAAFVRHDVRVVRDFTEVPQIVVEKHKVLQILVNILRNAKYALDEQHPPEKLVTVTVERPSEELVRISISDNGIGIPPETMTRIFEHGFTTRKEGHGFGLHSSAIAAKELGGALTAHSDGAGKGAVFTLELPLRTPDTGKR